MAWSALVREINRRGEEVARRFVLLPREYRLSSEHGFSMTIVESTIVRLQNDQLIGFEDAMYRLYFKTVAMEIEVDVQFKQIKDICRRAARYKNAKCEIGQRYINVLGKIIRCGRSMMFCIVDGMDVHISRLELVLLDAVPLNKSKIEYACLSFMPTILHLPTWREKTLLSRYRPEVWKS